MITICLEYFFSNIRVINTDITTMACQADLDNHANQCNPNNDEYWHSRGMDKPSDDEPESYNQQSYSSDDDDDYCEGAYYVNNLGVRGSEQQEEIIHIIDRKSVRYGKKYENTYCVVQSGRPPIVLPNTIPKRKMRSQYDGHVNSPVFAFVPPDETIEAYIIELQRWWRSVRRWPEKQKADACMRKAMGIRATIDNNRKRMTALTKELRELYVEDEKLHEECHKTFRGAIRYYERLCPEQPAICYNNTLCPRNNPYYNRGPDPKDIIVNIETNHRKEYVDNFKKWSDRFVNQWLKRKRYKVVQGDYYCWGTANYDYTSNK